MLKKSLLTTAIFLTIACSAFIHQSVANAQSEDSILDFIPSILAGIKKLPIPIDFSVSYPNIPSSSEYLIDTNDWDIPTNGSNAVKTTDNLQAAINYAAAQGHNRVEIPNGTYLIGKYSNSIYQAGIDLHSNTEYVFDSNAIVRMVTNDKWNYCVLRVQGKSNVKISGGILEGDKNSHIYTPRSSDGATAHDEGHGVCVWNNSSKININNMTIRNMTGDGSLLLESNNVSYTNNNIHSNRGQGISVVGGIRVAIEGNTIHNIRGTAPQFGVDIEGAGRIDRDIIIRNNDFHHNRGGDIVNTNGKNVFILNNTMDQGTAGSNYRYIDGPIVTWEKTNNVIFGNKITMYDGSVNGRLGYIQYSGGNDNNRTLTYVHNNVCNNCGMYMYNAEGADVRYNKFYDYFASFSNFSNLTLIDNLVTYAESGPTYCWSYRFRNVYGKASDNLVEGKPISIPLSRSKPYSLQCVLNGF